MESSFNVDPSEDAGTTSAKVDPSEDAGTASSAVGSGSGAESDEQQASATTRGSQSDPSADYIGINPRQHSE